MKIIKSIYLIFHKKIKKRKRQKQLFKQIESGDVIYALMPFSKKYLKKIPEGHRSRPYLIVKKNKHELIAYQCSSKLHNSFKIYEYYSYKQIVYESNKDSYFYLKNTYQIPIQNIHKVFHPIIDKDKKAIQRRLLISEMNGNRDLIFFDIEVQNEIGDIVLFNKKRYLVYQKDSSYLYTYLVSYKSVNKENEVSLLVSKKLYFIQVNNQQILNSNRYISTIWLLSKIEMQGFYKKKEELKKKKHVNNQQNNIVKFDYRIGTIITNDLYEEYIYLYTLNKKRYGIRVSVTKKEQIQIAKIKGTVKFFLYDKNDLVVTKRYLEQLITNGNDPHHVLEIILKKIS